MSRIGRMPIAVPSGVKVNVADGSVRVEGPKGKLSRELPPEVALAVESGTVNVSRTDETRRARGVHGLLQRLDYHLPGPFAGGAELAGRGVPVVAPVGPRLAVR